MNWLFTVGLAIVLAGVLCMLCCLSLAQRKEDKYREDTEQEAWLKERAER